MPRIGRGVGIGVLTVGALAVSAPLASAQGLSLSAAAEAGGDEIYVAFSELGWAASGLGFRPVASLGGYLVFTSGADSWGVIPAAGLRYVTDAGFIEGKVGWAFVEENAVPLVGGSDSGLHTAFHTEFYGSVYNAQGLVTYNWGAHYLWSRGRVGRRFGNLGTGGSWGLGAELTYQAETEDPFPTIEGTSTTQVGPVLMLTPRAGGASFVLGGGWKQTKFDEQDESTWYMKGEIFLP